MPTVPKYEIGQLQSRGINARQNIRVSSDAFGGNVAQAQIGLGKEVSKQSDLLFNQQMKIRDEYDKGTLREMDNNYSAHIREKMGEFSQLNGRAASDAKQQYIDGLNKFKKELSKNLDPRLANSWGAMADVRTNNAFNKINTHTVSQTIAYNKVQTLARINSSHDEMAANSHEWVLRGGKLEWPAVQAAKNVGITEIIDQLKDIGIDVNNPKDDGERDIIRKARLDFTSKGHIQVIKNLETDNAEKALEYYKKHKEEIDPESWNVVDALLKEGTDKIKSKQLAEAIMADPNNDTYEKQSAAAKAIKDATLSDLVVIRVDKQQADNIKNTKRVQDEAYDQVQKHIVAGGNKANLPSGVWDLMSGSQQRTLQVVLDTRITNALKPKNPIAAKKIFYAFEDLAYTNYEDFKKLRLDVYVGLMDEADIKTLRTLQKSHTAVKSSLTRKEQLKAALGSMGLNFDNFEAKGSKGDKIRSFVTEVDNRVADKTMSLNRELDAKEYQQILLDTIENKVYSLGYLGGNEQTVSTLNADQRKLSYIKIDGEEVHLGEIPEVDRNKIIDSLRRKGQAVNEKRIAQVWYRNQQTKTARDPLKSANKIISQGGFDYAVIQNKDGTTDYLGLDGGAPEYQIKE